MRYYRATFTIPTEEAAAATTLSGTLWADNQATRLWINGVHVTEFVPPVGGGSSFQTGDGVDFGSWGSGYYVAGENTMIIAVRNRASPSPPNPAGLLVRVPDAFDTASTCSLLDDTP